MDEVWKGLPPTNSEWKTQGLPEVVILDIFRYGLVHRTTARSRINDGETAIMSENRRNGRSASSVYPFPNTFFAYSKKR